MTLTNFDIKSHYAYLQEGGEFDVARAGWIADYADPENFLALYVSTNKTFNYGHYNNPKYDELMKKSYEERDPAKRYQILHDAERCCSMKEPVSPAHDLRLAVARLAEGQGLAGQRGERASEPLPEQRIGSSRLAGPPPLSGGVPDSSGGRGCCASCSAGC